MNDVSQIHEVQNRDVRLIRAISLVVLLAFIAILALVSAGFFTERRRVKSATEFANLIQASSQIGAVSQKLALLEFGRLGRREADLKARLELQIDKELELLDRQLDLLERGVSKTTLLDQPRIHSLRQLLSDSRNLSTIVRELQPLSSFGAGETDRISALATLASGLLETSRLTAAGLSELSTHTALEDERLIQQFYALSCFVIVLALIAVVSFVVLRLRSALAERRGIEARLRQANTELERFSAMVAHDLKGPLTNIEISARLLTHSPDVDSSLTAAIAHESDRLRNMVHALLKMAHIEVDPTEMNSVDLREVINEVQQSLRRQITESAATVSFTGDVGVRGNRILLHNVFQNLIENSIKYRSRESPKIELECKQEDTQVVIEYQDNGHGVAPEMRERVFDPFFQVGEQPSDPVSIGLGLSVVRKIITSHSGTIGIEEKSGLGTHFRITLPAADKASP